MTNLERVSATLRAYMPAQAARTIARQILTEQGYTEAMMQARSNHYREAHEYLREACKLAADGSCDEADTAHYERQMRMLDFIEGKK